MGAKTMRAMAVTHPGPIEEAPLEWVEREIPTPGRGEILIQVEMCGVCRTDLHLAEGDLEPRGRNRIPGHEVVGRIAEVGKDCTRFRIGDRVGVAWLHRSCGQCRFCQRGDENLCTDPVFTGWDVDGGYAEFMVAHEAFVYPIPLRASARDMAPFLCAGIIGYRSFVQSRVRRGQRLGIYGFGGSGHIVIQLARYFGCETYVFSLNENHRSLARNLNAHWVGGSEDRAPEKLDSAILFAPVGDLVPKVLEDLDRGGTLAIAGIHLTDIPSLNYQEHLFQERTLRSVTANTRKDGEILINLVREIPLISHTQIFPLEEANEALQRLKSHRIRGAAVLDIGASVESMDLP